MKLEKLIDEILEMDTGGTKAPWRYAQMIDGMNARMLIDGNGYHFGQIDDPQNGELIATYRNHAPKIARALRYIMEARPFCTCLEDEAECSACKKIRKIDAIIGEE